MQEKHLKSILIGMIVVMAILLTAILVRVHQDKQTIAQMEKANYEKAFNPLANRKIVDKSESEKELEESKLEYKQRQAEIKAEAIQADYWEIEEGNWFMKDVYATGEIVAMYEKLGTLHFVLFPVLSDTEDRGIYEVYCYPLFDESFNSLKEGDHVKIYGHVDLKNTETGAPQIYALLIEPIEQQDDNKE